MIPPFNPDATCPKCGSNNLRINWVAPYTLLDYSQWLDCKSGIKYNSKWERLPESLPDHPLVQHLHRTCECCHFMWPERCLDDVEQVFTVTVDVDEVV